MLPILLAILLLGILVTVHEFGHFIFARICGIAVREYAIGFGPRLLHWTGKQGTEFSIRLIPMGGYCAFYGEDTTDKDALADPRAFPKQAVWKRMLVTVAGATMNLILGFFLILAFQCLDSPLTSTRIAAFRENEDGESISTSSQWLQKNDRFVSINGLKIFTWQDISYALQNDTCDTFQVTVEREGELITYDEVTFLNTETKGLLDFYLARDEKNIGTILSHTVHYYGTTARLIWISLVDLIRGKYGFHDLSGVVGIIDATTTVVNMSETFREKLVSMLDILSFITINVGIFNLIPFPALDGGRLVFLIVEAIRRKPCPAKVEGMIHFVGLAALMLLMIAITCQDITKIFTR